MTTSQRHAIAVLGCHRSGTSVITRSLRVIGASLSSEMLPPIANVNDTGFFEDVDIHWALVRANRRLGRSWFELSSNSTTKEADDLTLSTLTSLLDEKVSSDSVFAFKNPRSVLFADTVADAFAAIDIEPVYVVAVRDPLSVAHSLQARDDFSLYHGAMLWLKYMTAAVAAVTAQSRVVFVHYERLLDNPGAELERIALSIGHDQIAILEDELETFRAEILDKALQHHRFGIDELEQAELSPILIDTYRDLCRLSEVGPDEAVQPSEELWRLAQRELDSLQESFRAIDHSTRSAMVAIAEQGDLAKQLEEAKDVPSVAELTRLTADLDRMASALDATDSGLRATTAAFESALERERTLEETLANRTDELNEALVQHGKLQAELDEASQSAYGHEEIAQLEATAARLLAERDQAYSELAKTKDLQQYEQEINRLEIAMAKLIAERDDARAKLGEQAAQAHEAQRDAQRLAEDLDKLHASTSWRLSRPVRVVGDLAKRRRGRG